jgi:hypothetical protein
MSFLKREWTDAEKWFMGIVSAVLLAAGATWWATLDNVVAEVASLRDRYGRCIDAEVVLRNDTKADAELVEVAFEVDFFTTQGTILLEYGDEKSQLIPSGQKTLLPRRPYVPIAYTMDQNRNVLTVGVLKPGQYIHLFLGGETVVDSKRADARDGLLVARDASLMDKPRVVGISRKDGRVKLRRPIGCPAA